MNDGLNIAKKNLYFINFKNLSFLLITIIFILFIGNKCEKHRKIINSLSEIHLVINGTGNQSLLNNTFYAEPYRVKVNGEYKESCKKFCEMGYEINNVILIFNENIETCDSMFYGSDNIIEMDLSNFDFSKVTNMSSMFRKCSNLEKIIFGNIDTSSVVNMKCLFYNCSSLLSVDVSNFDTSLVTTIEGMFYMCSNLASIDVTNFNTTRVRSLRILFYKCLKLETINLSNFDTSSVTNMEAMFYLCSNLLSIDLSNFNTQNVETMRYLFRNCSKLTSLDISNFNTAKVKNMAYLFMFCTNIKKINLGKLDTSSVEDMNCLFCYNEKLESIDLSSFDTSKVTNLGWMFFHCYNIKSIKISEKFKTSNVVTMYSMFSHCKALSHLNLSSFDTTKVTQMCFMFNNDINLKYLDISHFSPLNITTIETMFCNLKSLTFLNIYSFEINDRTDLTTPFKQFNNSIKICSNRDNMKNYLTNINNTNNCSDICFNKNIKVDPEKKECIPSCKDNGYSFECNNICYNECPEGTYPILKDINNKDNIFIEYVDGVVICWDRNPEGYYLDEIGFYRECFEGCKFCYGSGVEKANNCIECKSNYSFISDSINSTNCYKNCEYYYYFNENDDYICLDNDNCPDDYQKLVREKSKCIDKCENDDTYQYEYDNICYTKCPKGTIRSSLNYHCLGEKNILQNQIRNNEDIYQQLMDNIINQCDMSKGEEMVYQGDNNSFFHITSIENELDILEGKSNNTNKLSIIDLRKCETILKNIYEINENTSLIIMKYEKISNISTERSLQYEVYEPYNKTRLNISLCDKNIDIYIPVVLSEKTQNLYNELKELGYDLFDINSPFYNDICTPYKSPEGTDVLLCDRVNSYFNNEDTSCQTNCKFSNYLMESQYLKCECDSTNSEININKVESFSGKSIYHSFYDVLKYSNCKFLKCFKLAFTLNSISPKNLGSILTMAYFFFYFLFLIIHAIKGTNQLKDDFSKPIMNSLGNSNNKKEDTIEFSNIKKNKKKEKDKKHDKKKYKQDNKKHKQKQKLKNINSKEINIKNNNHNPPKKKLSIYKKPKDRYKFIKNQEKVKNSGNVISMSKNAIINSFSKRELNQYLNEKIKKNTSDVNKSELSQMSAFDNYELNNFEYDFAKKLDKRNCFQIYWSLLKREHSIIFTFITTDDHNITFIKYCRFFF